MDAKLATTITAFIPAGKDLPGGTLFYLLFCTETSYYTI